MNAVELLREQFNSHVTVREKRPGVMQLVAPLFHEDGDMMDVFLDVPKNGAASPLQKIRVSDHGLTLMRLSYTFDIDTPNKEKIFHRILAENGVAEENGELFIEAAPATLYTSLLQFSQAVSKVCNMRYFKREVLASLFDEMLAEFIQGQLPRCCQNMGQRVSTSVCGRRKPASAARGKNSNRPSLIGGGVDFRRDFTSNRNISQCALPW